jgi:MoxR-like ATPase
MTDWGIFHGEGVPHDGIHQLPEPPPWRAFERVAEERATTYQASADEVEAVNAALYLRRPLLITGRPGVGKSSLAYAVAHELRLGSVLRWSITTRSTLQEGLYAYDAIGRLQEASLFKESTPNRPIASDIGRFIRLGPLGTALLSGTIPRVLLVDEIDKSDVDLPNDLLHVFEEGMYVIPELARLPAETETVMVMTWDGKTATVGRGQVRCSMFPFVIFTSNGEREFPPAFLRRCLRLNIQPPNRSQLQRIVVAHLRRELGSDLLEQVEPLIGEFLRLRDEERAELATDQLLNAVYLATQQVNPLGRDRLRALILQSLASG